MAEEEEFVEPLPYRLDRENCQDGLNDACGESHNTPSVSEEFGTLGDPANSRVSD